MSSTAPRSVYRIDLKNKKATLVARFGQKANGGTVASPRFIGLGATSDLLILDSKNVLWRWRPADATGKGTLVKIDVNGSSSWGDDIRGFGTYLRDEARNLYNLYIVDPSEQQILAYSPSADGGGFPGAGSPWLATARDVSELSSIYIDGDVFTANGGELVRFVSGKSDGWDASAPDDTLLRPRPTTRWSPVASAPTGGPAGSTPTTSRTPGSSPSTRPTGRTRRSTGWPAASRAGTTCARSTWSRAWMTRRPSSSGSPSDGLHQSSLEAVPDVAPSPRHRPRPGRRAARARPPSRRQAVAAP